MIPAAQTNRLIVIVIHFQTSRVVAIFTQVLEGRSAGEKANGGVNLAN